MLFAERGLRLLRTCRTEVLDRALRVLARVFRVCKVLLCTVECLAGRNAVCCVAVCFAGTVFSFDAGGVAVCPTPTEQIMTVDRAQGKSFRMLAITIKTASSDHFPDFYASRWAKLFAAGQFSVPRSRAPLSKKMAHYFASILRL
jgi:hypothetical protein